MLPMIILALFLALTMLCIYLGDRMDHTTRKVHTSMPMRILDRMLNGPLPQPVKTWTPQIDDGVVYDGKNYHVTHPDLLDFALMLAGQNTGTKKALRLHAHPLNFNYELNDYQGEVVVDGARLVGKNLTKVHVASGSACLEKSICKVSGEKSHILLKGGYVDVRDNACAIITGKNTRATVRCGDVKAYAGSTVEAYKDSSAIGSGENTRIYLYENATGKTHQGAHLACFHTSIGIAHNTPHTHTNGTLWPLKGMQFESLFDQGDVFSDGENIFEITKAYIDLTQENRAQNVYELRVLTLTGVQADIDNLEMSRDELNSRLHSLAWKAVDGHFEYEGHNAAFVTKVADAPAVAKTLPEVEAYFAALDDEAAAG